MSFTSFTSNQGTQTPILTDTTGGTVNGTVIAVQKVDISGQGTAGTLWNGGVTGTINSGSIVVTVGTTQDTVVGGTLGSVLGVGGTTSVSVIGGTVSVNELSGTLNLGSITGNIGMSSGTLTTGTILSSGTSTGVGTISNIGSLGMLNAGTITTLPNIPGGTVNLTQAIGTIGTLGLGSVVVNTLPNLPQGSINVTAGTIATLGTMGTLGLLVNGTLASSGTTTGVGVVSVLTKGTISLGSVGGIDANAVAQTGNPISIGGTDSGGTVRTIKVDSGGLQRVGLDSGTVSVLPNLPQGSINVTAGTITSGSIVVTAGTFVGNGGSVISYGPAAAAAAAAGNPLNIGGTDSGGTIRTILVDSTGVQRASGSIVMTVGTVSVLPNLPQGSINVTAGTIASVGTIGTLGLGTITGNLGTIGTLGTLINLGSVTNIGQVYNAGTLQLGTVVGKDAPAVARTGNPIVSAGTDSGGTVYGFLTDTKGQQYLGGGTVSMLNAGTITTLQNGTFLSTPLIMEIDYGTITNPVYVGYANPGLGTNSVGWMLINYTYDANGNPLSALYANGSATFVNTWSNHGTYTYS